MAALSVSARMRFPSACFKSSACFFACSAFFKMAERTCSAHCVSGTFGISAATCSRSAVPSVRFLSQIAAFPFAFSRAALSSVFRLFHDSQTDFLQSSPRDADDATLPQTGHGCPSSMLFARIPAMLSLYCLRSCVAFFNALSASMLLCRKTFCAAL